MKSPKEDNRLFVLELTNDLRNAEDEFWATLKRLIIDKGVDINSIALCQFCESEEGIEYGLLVARNYVVEFQHESDNTQGFKLWRETIEPILIYSDCQKEVDWTREMLANGEI